MVKVDKKIVDEAIRSVKKEKGSDKCKRFKCYTIFAERKRKQVRGERVRWDNDAYAKVDAAFPRGLTNKR